MCRNGGTYSCGLGSGEQEGGGGRDTVYFDQEGRRINEGKAHKPDEPESRSFRGMQATRAVMRDADRDVPPDAEGQERSGHIEQTITPDGGTQTR